MNPVAVLINKAMIETPPIFAGCPPVNPEWRRKAQARKKLTPWIGAHGLAEDVRYYGRWMRDEAEKRIGHLYPKVGVSEEMCRDRPDLEQYEGRELTVVAWLWARTVRSSNPAFADVEVPLVSSFWLSKTRGKEAWVEPVVEGREWRFKVRHGTPGDPKAVGMGTRAGERKGFRCLMSKEAVTYEHVQTEGRAGRMGTKLMALVANGRPGRVYLSPDESHAHAAADARPTWGPDVPLPNNTRDFKTPLYGLTTFAHLFSPRQLVALTTFSDLVAEVRNRVRRDAAEAGMHDGGKALHDGRSEALVYGEAVSTCLSFVVDKSADYGSTLASWHTTRHGIRNTFNLPALKMTWDYSEANPFSGSTGSLSLGVDQVSKVLKRLPSVGQGSVYQEDAQRQRTSTGKVVSTDPPYYDNISYADLSDFFYVWLRRSLSIQLPEFFMSMTVPKAEELVATPYRHKDKEAAKEFFLDGMRKAIRRLARDSHPDYPVTIYYAFKQAGGGGWETFLEAVIQAGFSITSTWPIRTELTNRPIGLGANALDSSIVVVCRKQQQDASVATRQQFRDALGKELPSALRLLMTGNIAPVDLAQASVGFGMAIFTRFDRVVHPDGGRMPVYEALDLINQELGDALEDDFDSDTRWALDWFALHGFDVGKFDDANKMAVTKNTVLSGLVKAGALESQGGEVRLRRYSELPKSWNAKYEPTVWEKAHRLLRCYYEDGVRGAAKMLTAFGSWDNSVRDLAYRTFLICEHEKWANLASGYDELVRSWPEIVLQARQRPWADDEDQFELMSAARGTK